jgi:lipoyl(octanoyl) transferase
MSELEFVDWGLIDYEKSLEQQLELVAKVEKHRDHGYLVFCKHPPVVTLGRKSTPEDITTWSGPRIEVARGGRATYHGPSQLVIYPIVSILAARKGRGPQEVQGFIRDLENGIISALADFGISAIGKSVQMKPESVGATTKVASEETGVWVGSRKIASLGLGIKNWVTYHGAAINVHQDPNAFQGMRPCGFAPDVMIDIESIVGRSINEEELKKNLQNNLLQIL